jgi:hypothetical protein
MYENSCWPCSIAFPLLLLKKLNRFIVDFTLLPNDNRMIDCFLTLWIHCFSCALDKMLTNNNYYNTLHNVFLYKGNKTICVFHGIFADNPDFSVRFRNCIFYTGNNFVVFCKAKYSSHKHPRVKTVNAFISGKHQVVNPRRNNHFRCSPHMQEIIV